jgi:hypothetical protein
MMPLERPLRHLGGIALLLCAGTTSAGAAPAAAPPATSTRPYVEPPPIRIYRFHVYSTMKSRWKKTILIDSLVSTSQGSVVAGDRGVLERKISTEGSSTEWAPVANVVVKKLLPKGRIQAEIESEEPEASTKRNGKLPFSSGQKVRLQIDRVLNEAG